MPPPCLTEMFSGSPNDALCEDLPITPTFMEMSLSIIARCILACDLVFFFFHFGYFFVQDQVMRFGPNA